jgi:hypothetical protein
MVTDCVRIVYGLCSWVGTHVKNDHVFRMKVELEAGGGPCVLGFELDVVKRAPTGNPFGGNWGGGGGLDSGGSILIFFTVILLTNQKHGLGLNAL